MRTPTCREKVLLSPARGGGSAIATRDRLDQPALGRARQERLQTFTRQAAVRGLALGFDAVEIAEALKRELAMHGHPLPPTVPPTPLDQDEVLLLTARNRLHATSNPAEGAR